MNNMFGNKKRDSRINRTELDIESNRGMVIWSLKEVERIDKKLKAIENYLNIEWKEETTKGYVKKEEYGNPPIFEISQHDIDEFKKELRRGRKSNNKKK